MTQPPSPSAAALYAINDTGTLLLLQGKDLSWVDNFPEAPGVYAATHEIDPDDKASLTTIWRQVFSVEAAERAKPAASDLEAAHKLLWWLIKNWHAASGEVEKHIAAALAERGRVEREAERARCVEILHEEGWLGRSEQRIAHPEDNQTTNDEA